MTTVVRVTNQFIVVCFVTYKCVTYSDVQRKFFHRSIWNKLFRISPNQFRSRAISTKLSRNYFALFKQWQTQWTTVQIYAPNVLTYILTQILALSREKYPNPVFQKCNRQLPCFSKYEKLSPTGSGTTLPQNEKKKQKGGDSLVNAANFEK